MIALLQRVSQANVTINENQTIAQIGQGLLVLIGIEKTDTMAVADRLLKRILNYRVFNDADDKMNLSLLDIKGDLLLVPQFTLPADTRKGNRPSFTPAAPPDQGKQLFDSLLAQARLQTLTVEAGQFAADMQVSLTNEGPVTFWLQVN